MNRKGHIVDYADDYLHGVLSEEDASYVEHHCEDCRICQVALEEARRRYEALQAEPIAEASEELIQNTLVKVQAAHGRQRRLRKTVLLPWMLATAASIAILAGVHIHYLNLSPTSSDLQVYGQTTLLAGTPASLRVRLLDKNTNRRLAGIPVDVELRDQKSQKVFRLASFKTDAEGTGSPRFQLPDAPEGQYELRVVALTPGHEELLSRTIKLARSWKLMLSTDKPVYQPGQVIHVRSLALRTLDLHPVAGEKLTFSITDPKGNVIFKRQDVSSAYGIASTDCPLADEILEGAYTVACRVGDTESKVTVEVKKYVLPKFKVAVDLDQPFYQPGQTVHGTIHVNYFFGKPVAGGETEIVVRTTELRSVELARLAARTDAQGEARFDYRLPDSLIGHEQDAGDARVSFEVTVRDAAGQEQTRYVRRDVTVNPIRLEVIPESGRLVRGVKNTVYVFACYADGRPAQAQLAITDFNGAPVTSPLGVASFELTPTSDQITMLLRATDNQGLVGRRQVTLNVGQTQQDFLVRTDKAVYAGGETARLTVLGGGVEPVFVDFIKDGQTILTEVVNVVDGHGESVFDLPPDLFGTIEILAYRFGDAGLPVRKSRVIYVEQARALKIAAELDRGEYRPGEQAKLVMDLTDDSGKPTPGALSLAAVDEAVFSVLEQAPGMERTFFNLEQKLLQPIYAIYNWTPNLETSAFDPADRNGFEQALFSRTARDLGGRADVFDQLLKDNLITDKQLDVLDRADVNELAGRLPLPDSMRQALQGSESPHSLAAMSYPSKLEEVQHARLRALEIVKWAWAVLGIAIVGTGVVVLLILVRRAWAVALALVLGLLLAAAFFLPTLSRARELSQLTVAAANLRGIGQAMEVWKANPAGSILRNATRDGGEQPAIRVREWFPETLLWRPELITDDAGRASIDIDLADSITTWRLTASAVAADGRLGGLNSAIRVFQPFFVDLNLPVALTRGDEVAVPVVVYNYLDQPQTVDLTLDTEGTWFELLDEPIRHVQLATGEVQSTSFRIRAKQAGRHELQVTARGSGIGDAIKRTIEVVPDGRRVAKVFNGTLSQAAVIELPVPANAIEGSLHATLKIYPSSFSQVLEGLEGIFQRPFGCFEQTSSTTYPNVLALDYLRQTKKSVPTVEAQTRQYIHLGYQRLLGFEVSGGGFDWFGRPPANRTLTAYGLMEFEDMARVHDVDPRLIERTRTWLMSQRNPDGSWSPESHRMHTDPTVGADDAANLSTTAYIAWSVFSGGADRSQAAPTKAWLLAHSAGSIKDPYVLALVCNALLAINPDGPEARPYLAALLDMKQASADGKQISWKNAPDARTAFYGAGASGDIETTSLATLALLKSRTEPATTRAALTWLVGQKDRLGTWHTTQATVLALRALVAGTGQPLGGDQERVIEFGVNGAAGRQIVISADQADVMQQISLSADLATGTNRLALTERSGTGVGYQVDFSYHVPEDESTEPPAALSINIAYDRSDLRVGDMVWAEAAVVNNMPQVAPMVILDLPIPAGFAADPDSLGRMVQSGQIAKYQITARSIIVYLRELAPAQPLNIRYRLDATMPVRITVPPARVYEYYDPSNEGSSRSTELTVVSSA